MRRLGVLTLSIAVLLTGAASAIEIRGIVVDTQTGQPLPARVYLQDEAGGFHFVRMASATGSAIRYDKRNWINPRSVEQHTTLSAHSFVADVAPGKYMLTVERGKEYFPETVSIIVRDQPETVTVKLRRWIDMAQRGWYSGETHLHRTIEELPNVMLAEDLNVAFPLSYWVTKAYTSPSSGDRNMAGAFPAKLVTVDDRHVIWPRNTEYEIFTVGGKRHTLGALFILNHQSLFDRGIPPVGAVTAAAKAEGALLDMDKLDWPFGMTLPQSSGATLYELANNHLWRTEFAFRDWNTSAPGFLVPPIARQRGGERDWLQYTLGMYYTLLNAGFRLVPTAGTASGVHPVPAGFSRVYVHLPHGFDYKAWLQGLAEGRSFVTTGPMLFAKLDGRQVGETLRLDDNKTRARVEGTIVSEQPISYLEVVVNGEALVTIMPRSTKSTAGAIETTFATDVPFSTSGWVVVRAFEDRPNGRFRFAHTAPWWIEIPGRPLKPRREEVEYLAGRVRQEIARSQSVLRAEDLKEYEASMARFKSLTPRPEDIAEVRRPSTDADLRFWLENMVWHHRYSPDEIRAATGMSRDEIEAALKKFDIHESNCPLRAGSEPLLVLPFPGGRHPRTGFRDGAIAPQRDTKLSVFAPWNGGGYAVVDLPEALWSNLGLTYLAHTHIPTVWSRQDIKMARQEWTRHGDGSLRHERTLPNGIRFGAKATPKPDGVEMELWLHNGSAETLSDLRVQVCTMLQGLTGFAAQTNQNKRFQYPWVAGCDESGRRWIVTGWSPTHRTWANPPVPCLHSDPKFPDCPPGQSRRLRGWLSYYEGDEIEAEIRRLAEKTGIHLKR